MQNIFSVAKRNNCKTVIAVHNHPHTLERYWNLLSPSKEDLQSYDYMKGECEENGFNLIGALCAQGDFIIYGQHFASRYYPDGCSPKELMVQSENNQRECKKMRRELIFKSPQRIRKLTGEYYIKGSSRIGRTSDRRQGKKEDSSGCGCLFIFILIIIIVVLILGKG